MGFCADLSRFLSHALRHEPWLYELELDDEGWARLDQVLAAIRRRGGTWVRVDRGHVEEMINLSERKRHELRGDYVRALYGHTLPGRLSREKSEPPEVLFHGTSPDAMLDILGIGLMPMGRQYVHLSVDHATASAVGRRKHKTPVVLCIDAGRANARGVAFYCGNRHVWLADTVPSEFISPAYQFRDSTQQSR